MKKLPAIAILVFLIFAILIFFNNNIPPVHFLISSVQSIFTGPKSALYGLKAGFSNDSALKRENQMLTQKLIDYERIKQDNIALRSQFETTETKNFTLLPARVLAFSGNLSEPQSLIVDAGERENIKSGMGVLVNKNLVGKIGKVSDSFSEVILATNPSFKTLAKTSDTNAAGVASGNNDFILFDRVSVNDNVTKNSYLLTSGVSDNSGIGIPADLVIGKIVSVNRSQSLPFQTGKVVSPINFGKLQTVFIVKNF